MKKIIALLLLAAIVISGCARQPAPQTEPPTEPPVEEIPFGTEDDLRKYVGTRLQFFSLLAEEDPAAQAVTQAAAVFARQTGAEVIISWYAGDEQALIRDLEAGNKADLFEISGVGLRDACLNDALDLTELAEAADYDSHSYAALRRQVVERCGYLAGIPCTPYLTGVYYNRDAFAACGIDRAPDGWEEFLTACRSLASGGCMPLAMDAENAHIALELHMERSLGAERVEALLRDGEWEKDAGAMRAVGQLCDFVSNGFLDGPMEYPAGQNRLALSNAAMAAGSNRLCAQVEETTLTRLSWGVFPWPGDGPGTGTAVDADVLAIHRETPNARAAFEFVMLLTTGEFDQLRADLSRGIPADPANESTISGAVEALSVATSRSVGLLSADENGRILKLWQGKYTVKIPAE